MSISTAVLNLKRLRKAVDWELLLFLILFLNVKLAVKIPAVALIYLLRFNFRFGFSFKNSRLPLFYPLIMAAAVIGMVVNRSYAAPNYIAVLITGIGFWVLCLLAIHQVKLAVERDSTAVLHKTVLVFFILNAIVSIFNLGAIILETGTLNPYTYQGQFQKYFIGTGDYIKGLTFDTSTTNAVLNAFGVIYFLARKNALMLLICMAVLLLTGSNFVNLVLLFVLALVFLFRSSKEQQSLIMVCLLFLVVFMAKVSPQNNGYVTESFKHVFKQKEILETASPAAALPLMQKPDSLLNTEEKKQKIATLYLDSVHQARDKIALHKNRLSKDTSLQHSQPPVTETGRIEVPKADINSAPYQSLTSTPPEQRQLVGFISSHKTVLPISGKPYHWSAMPGKVTGLLQTANFFRHHPGKIIFGDGMGNFSSKLAFRASGLGFTGGYPARYAYINPDFLAGHLDLYLNFFSQRAGFHSLTNSPFSVYDQLLAEYGFAGLLIFGICYIGFFTKHRKTLSYGLPILLLTGAILFTDYWFEQLSVLVFFELLLLLDMKESADRTKELSAHTNKINYGH